jgi:hypothetical protein
MSDLENDNDGDENDHIKDSQKNIDHKQDELNHHKEIINSTGRVDASAVTAGGSMYFGSGNSPNNYHLEQNTKLGLELGLKEHYRTGYDIAPVTTDANGTEHFNAPAGPQIVDTAHGVYSANPNRSAWNFDFVVDTGLGKSKDQLSDYSFKIAITQNGTNTHVFDLNATTHVWVDEANPAVGFGGDDFNSPASADVKAHVAENSVNLAFLTGAFGPLATADAHGTTYDIKLEAFKGHGVDLVGIVHDVVTLV